jgi:hypothetical protein
MKNTVLKTTLLSVTLFGLFACSKKSTNLLHDAPQCLNSKLVEFRKSGCPSRDSLKQYTFQGKTVYVYHTGLCGADYTSPVVDDHCNSLGFLGGFAGNSKINGDDFSKAVYVKTIWNN